MPDKTQTLYDRLGGRPTLERVHKIFYDKLFADDWLRPFFEGIDQKVLESQQTDFQSGPMGGPKIYCGKFAVAAHKHMFITDEMFDHRQSVLAMSLKEANVPAGLAAEWLVGDEVFRRKLVKKDVASCKKRFNTDSIIVVDRPRFWGGGRRGGAGL